MSEPFDPYLRWLGIRDPERPPNHYRLLGIDLFESDPEVIASAADRQMSHVRTYQTSAHSVHSQRILNELAAARICLLKPERKAPYDAQLQGQIKPASPVTKAVSAAPIVCTSASAAPQAVIEPDFLDISDQPTARRTRRKQSNSLAPVAIVAGALLLAAVVGMVVWSQQADEPQVAKNKIPDRKPGSSNANTSAKTIVNDDSEEKNPSAVTSLVKPTVAELPQTPIVDTPQDPEENIKTPDSENPVEPPAAEPAQPAETPTFEPGGDTESAPTISPTDDFASLIGAPGDTKERLPIPDDEAQRQAVDRVREVYEEDFSAAKNSDQLAALAEKLRQQAEDAGNDVATKFGLLSLAENLAVNAGDIAKSLAAVERKSELFELCATGEKLRVAQRLPKQMKSAEQRAQLNDIVAGLVDDAVAANDFDTAVKAAHLAAQAAMKSKDTIAKKDATAKERKVKALQKAYKAAKSAVEKLRESPDDVEARFDLGAYVCFVKQDWHRGAKWLAASKNPTIAQAVHQELTAPSNGEAQRNLADLWWNAVKSNDVWGAEIRDRARFWYEKSLDSLVGLAKAEVEIRLKTLQDSAGSTVSNASGMVTVSLKNGETMKFRRVAPGSFVMQVPKGEQQKVTLTHPFYLGVTEVTQGQWQAIMGNNPSATKGNSNLPVEQVSWEDCQQFCANLSRFAGRGHGRFRLPTEAEWEYACRAGSTSLYHFGDNPQALPQFAWFDANSQGHPHPVGTLKPNAWGFHDMTGNVAELCFDVYGPYSPAPVVDPIGPEVGLMRCRRGGCYIENAVGERSGDRGQNRSNDRHPWLGMRLVFDGSP